MQLFAIAAGGNEGAATGNGLLWGSG